MDSLNLISQITYDEIRNDPALCGRVMAYLSIAVHGLPEDGSTHKWLAAEFAKEVAKIKESR